MARPNKRESHERWPVGNGLYARIGPARDAAEIGALWRTVEAGADGSVFQSWLWLGCRFAARFDRAHVLTIETDNRMLAIGLLNRGGARFGLARYWLSETGTPTEDSVFIEHNGPLVVRDRPEARDAWFTALLRQRPKLGWPELGWPKLGWPGFGRFICLSGLGAADLAAAQRHGVVDGGIVRQAPRRDIARLRAAGVDCLDQVSANTRQQINRALRLYEASGALSVARAGTAPAARQWLAALAERHQATWRARGKPGAFANAAFRDFHAALADRGTASGEVDLLRIAAGDRLIGYLYNFVWRGTVSAYQSGFVYDPAHPHEKPGLVCHVAAMRYYQARGLDCYDFLAGDDRYKTSLADGNMTLYWVSAAPRVTLAGAILAARARIGVIRNRS
ncbi:MAG: GNAT family N-acetyltransferase [Acidiphilium sp.]|nr:GNAT family N-acetyltransferase [Acidiphilium sp.]MDD4936332.1 GNAT family N-acetyltransferase [Acidiphilium sp.]